jgi:outer membrane autotransporter protein
MQKELFMFFPWIFLVCFICLTGLVRADDVRLVNRTQESMSNAMADVCSQAGFNQQNLNNRCAELGIEVNGNFDLIRLPIGTDASQNPVNDAITQIAPEQAIVPSVQATRTMRGMLGAANAAIISRMMLLRAQMRNPHAIRFANRLQQNPGLFSFDFRPSQSGGSAGIADISRLGIWGNGNYTGGNVDTSTNQLGFSFNNWGGDLGADYRINNNIVVGAAFSYMGTNANVVNSASTVKSDSYTGSIFSMYTHDSGFYVDGIASYGGVNYELFRSIQYDTINTTTNSPFTATIPITGKPDALQYSFGGGIGYQYSIGATSIEPFARANYQELIIDSFNESNAAWAMHFNKQHISSLPTTVGLRLSHAFSTSWGVFQPQIHGAWNHEFSDDQHIIQARYINSTSPDNKFSVVAQSPDRDYFTVGASLVATLSHGISVFTQYGTILGYQDLSSHRVAFGGRIEF